MNAVAIGFIDSQMVPIMVLASIIAHKIWKIFRGEKKKLSMEVINFQFASQTKYNRPTVINCCFLIDFIMVFIRSWRYCDVGNMIYSNFIYTHICGFNVRSCIRIDKWAVSELDSTLVLAGKFDSLWNFILYPYLCVIMFCLFVFQSVWLSLLSGRQNLSHAMFSGQPFFLNKYFSFSFTWYLSLSSTFTLRTIAEIYSHNSRLDLVLLTNCMQKLTLSKETTANQNWRERHYYN